MHNVIRTYLDPHEWLQFRGALIQALLLALLAITLAPAITLGGILIVQWLPPSSAVWMMVATVVLLGVVVTSCLYGAEQAFNEAKTWHVTAIERQYAQMSSH